MLSQLQLSGSFGDTCQRNAVPVQSLCATILVIQAINGDTHISRMQIRRSPHPTPASAARRAAALTTMGRFPAPSSLPASAEHPCVNRTRTPSAVVALSLSYFRYASSALTGSLPLTLTCRSTEVDKAKGAQPCPFAWQNVRPTRRADRSTDRGAQREVGCWTPAKPIRPLTIHCERRGVRPDHSLVLGKSSVSSRT